MADQKEMKLEKQDAGQVIHEREESTNSDTGAATEWEEKYKRLAADFANYKKRIAGERANLESRIEEKLLKDILTLYDDLVRLNDHLEHLHQLEQGVQAVKNKWQQWLEDNDIKTLHPEGEEFDHNFHDAVLQESVNDPELDGKITRVVENGYMRRNQVLRHAKVAVGRFEGHNNHRENFENNI